MMGRISPVVNFKAPAVSFKAVTITPEAKKSVGDGFVGRLEEHCQNYNEAFEAKGYDAEYGVARSHLRLKLTPQQGGSNIVVDSKDSLYNFNIAKSVKQTSECLLQLFKVTPLLERCKTKDGPIRIRFQEMYGKAFEWENIDNQFKVDLAEAIKKCESKYENSPLRLEVDYQTTWGSPMKMLRLVRCSDNKHLDSSPMNLVTDATVETAFKYINGKADMFLEMYQQGVEAGKKSAADKQ